MDSIVLVVIVVALVLVLAAAGLLMARRRRSDKLRRHFGSEYERTVAESGDRKAAEAALADRERRHRDLDIRTLRPEERDGYRREWESVQAGFVDDPAGALREADALVVEIMRTRGYPVDDFDRRAEDISVAHPEVVHHYREARAVHDASGDGGVDTERQRHALTSYRSLVDALLGHGDSDERDGDKRDGDERDGDRPGHHAATSGAATDGHPTRSRTTRSEEQAR
ncbi:hypothetical protein [Pseudonocardia sp.]|uniref:hypothetical protein n=1 Tax=Pseudonocardia sp. TaxID=60912 RepID=UPI003D0FC4A1